MDKELQSALWMAFTTLSDAQALIEFKDVNGANREINHAKLHIHEIMKTWSDRDMSEAMSSAFQPCSVSEQMEKFR